MGGWKGEGRREGGGVERRGKEGVRRERGEGGTV